MSTAAENSVSFDGNREPSIAYISAPLTGNDSLMEFHHHLLLDRVRTGSFIEAIVKTVKPGDVVADLGTGTGILAMACRRAGARKVYAVERDPLVRHSYMAACDNGMKDEIVFIAKDSSKVELPEQADVVVSECLGLMGLGGTMIPAVQAFAERWLKPGGRIIPASVGALLVPVESPLHFDYAHCWIQEKHYGFDLSAFRVIAENNVYIAHFDPSGFLCAPRKVGTVSLANKPFTRLDARLAFAPERTGLLHGFCGWFEADLGEGVALSASPCSPPTIWRQVYFPLEEAAPVKPGSAIELDFGIVVDPEEQAHFRWNTEIVPAGCGEPLRFRQSTQKSYTLF